MAASNYSRVVTVLPVVKPVDHAPNYSSCSIKRASFFFCFFLLNTVKKLVDTIETLRKFQH